MLSEFNTFCGQYENIIKAFGALAPFFGTCFLAYIAYQQWQTNERKRRHELFEERKKYLFQNACSRNFLISLDKKINNEITNDEFKIFLDSYVIDLRNYKINAQEYEYLISKSDYSKLFKLYNQAESNIEKIIKDNLLLENNMGIVHWVLLKQMKIQLDINSILESYLRIEQEKSIWDLCFKFIKNFFIFLNPNILKRFENIKNKLIFNTISYCELKYPRFFKKVILNLFQNLAKKKQEPTSNVD